MSEYLFDPSLISAQVRESIGPDFSVRPLSINDFENGYMEILQTLTTVGDVTKEMYEAQFSLMKSLNKYIVVFVETKSNKIAASGALLVELKFAQNCGKVGHIEDVAVIPSFQGRKLGFLIISVLKAMAVDLKCYKISLNCNEGNIPFYQKCGLEKRESQMVLYIKSLQRL
ncbi:hypothetical protein BB561_001461 [Smittium simulii]|uniref:Glucosamine 6-phosphate N-acetyltransferase n=1 Tax=Smittium simulii TaxID=133385 RepID=A0A2T9YUG8_9FUNG|nr:hypothetical protein BB561_001461 [Smittium simulii]